MDADFDLFGDSFEESNDAKIEAIPVGHCLVNARWKNNGITRSIGRTLTLKYVDGLGPVDFQPAAGVVVVYLAEGDAICDPNLTLKPKLEKLERLASERKAQVTLRGLVVFLKTPLTAQYMIEAQSLVFLNFMNASFLPISNPEQLGQLLQQLGKAENKRKNPFKEISKLAPSNVQRDILLTTCQIPGVGEVKARKMLNKYGSIKKMARARKGDLEPVVGKNLARGIEDFFDKKNSI